MLNGLQYAKNNSECESSKEFAEGCQKGGVQISKSSKNLFEFSEDFYSEVKEENRDLLMDIAKNLLSIANDGGKLKTLATVVAVWAKE